MSRERKACRIIIIKYFCRLFKIQNFALSRFLQIYFFSFVEIYCAEVASRKSIGTTLRSALSLDEPR